jgi:hypothetical protein
MHRGDEADVMRPNHDGAVLHVLADVCLWVTF